MVWKIILGIILFIYILLRCSVRARISASNGKLEFSVKYLFFQLYPRREKSENKKAKISKNNKSHKHSDEKKREKLEAELQKEKEALEKALAKANITADDDSFEKIAEKIKVNYPEEGKPPIEEGKKPKNKLKEKPDDKPEDKPKKSKINELKELYHKFKPYVPIALRAIKRMKNAIRIRELYFRLAVADEDAYECAMKYGKANAAVYAILAVLKCNLNIKIKNIIIESKFNSNKSEYEIDLIIKIRPSTVLAIGLRASFSALWLILKEKIKNKKNKETELLKT